MQLSHCSCKVCQKEVVVQTFPEVVLHAFGCSIPQRLPKSCKLVYHISCMTFSEPGICPYMEQGMYIQDMIVFIKHQSVRLLVEAFGEHGCDPPMGNGFLKGEVGLDYDHTEVFVHKYPWLGGEETSSFESACDCLGRTREDDLSGLALVT